MSMVPEYCNGIRRVRDGYQKCMGSAPDVHVTGIRHGIRRAIEKVFDRY